MQLFGRTRENECRQELLSAGRELLSPSAEGEREEGFLLAGTELLSPCPKKEVEERKEESFSGEFSLLRPGRRRLTIVKRRGRRKSLFRGTEK